MAHTFRAAALAALTVLGLSLAACSSGSPSGGTEDTAGTGSGDLTPVTVGLLSIAPSAAIQYGIDEGIFEAHGLDVTVQIGQGGAALLPAVSTGSIQFAVGNPLSVLVAADKGLDMRIIAGFSNSKATGDDINAVVALTSSGIASFSDLAGKTVSVNAVNTQGDLTIKAAAAAEGVDPSSIAFTEIGFADALAQLERGNVDAVWIPEPFLSQAVADDSLTVVGYPNQAAIPGLPTMVTFTSGAYAEAEPEVVDAFRDAVGESLAAASEDSEGFRTTIASFTGMDAAVAADLRFEDLSGEIDETVLQQLADLAVEYGFLENEPDLGTVILTQ